jgi:hypothetical protein
MIRLRLDGHEVHAERQDQEQRQELAEISAASRGLLFEVGPFWAARR